MVSRSFPIRNVDERRRRRRRRKGRKEYALGMKQKQPTVGFNFQKLFGQKWKFNNLYIFTKNQKKKKSLFLYIRKSRLFDLFSFQKKKKEQTMHVARVFLVTCFIFIFYREIGQKITIFTFFLLVCLVAGKSGGSSGNSLEVDSKRSFGIVK